MMFHPVAQTHPLVGCIRLDSVNAKYSDLRYGDTLETPGKPVGTITRLSRMFWSRTEAFGVLSYAINASFPSTFQFIGCFTDQKGRIGECVPPRFMFAIAHHVCYRLLKRTQVYTSVPFDFVQWPVNPETPRLFTVISTFAGCGGSSLGYKWAGGTVLAAVEWNKNAVETYRLNHKGTPVLHRDICTVSVEELLQVAGIQVGELDVFDGSPPCQGFSVSGKRQISDPRNTLFHEYVRLLRGIQPKVFVMENVAGLVQGPMKHIFALMMRELKASGYQVQCRLMNALYFGVPQSRERVIFIGIRNDVHSTLLTQETGNDA